MEPTYSSDEIAAMLNFSIETVCDWFCLGQLSGFMDPDDNQTWLASRTDLIEFIKRKRLKMPKQFMDSIQMEEEDPCPEENCDGIMGHEPVRGCCCHICPPCSACVNNPLVCLKCGWNYEDDE